MKPFVVCKCGKEFRVTSVDAFPSKGPNRGHTAANGVRTWSKKDYENAGVYFPPIITSCPECGETHAVSLNGGWMIAPEHMKGAKYA